MAQNRSDIILGVQNRTSAELRNVGRDLRAAATEATRAERAFTQMERGIDRVRDSEIRAARASGDYGRALHLIDGELSRTSQGTARYNDLLARQARASKQAEEGSRSFTSAINGIQSAFGAVGIGLGIQQVVQFGASSFTESQKLQGTEQSIRILAGSTGRYNQVLDLARQNQTLYGGTLSENIGQLTGFTVASRRAGVEVKTLNDLSKRLNVLSPEQAAQGGASIAINEALSGNSSSLVKRFEISKSLLKGIDDASTSPIEKLAIIDAALTKSGVTLEAVTSSVTDAQKAVNDANAAWGNLSVTFGQVLAPTVTDVATGLERVIKLAQGTPGVIAEIRAGLSHIDTTGNTSKQIEQTGATIFERNGGLGNLFNARAANNQASSVLEGLRPIFDLINKDTPQSQAKLQGLLDQFANGEIPVQQLSRATSELYAQIQITANASTDAKVATQEYMAATIEQIGANQKSAAAQQEVNVLQKELAELAGRVAAGLLGNADAASILASHYGFASGEAYRLVAAQAALATPSVTEGRLERDTPADRAAGAAAGAAAARARAEALAAATRAQTEALESSAQRAARLRRELAQLTPATAAYVAKQTELTLAERQAAAERTRSARSAATADTRAVRSAEEIRKARFDLLSTEQQIADLKQRVASGRLGEADRLEATKQIRDLEQKITDEREKQTKSAIDARLAALDDRKQQRIELREAAAARRILASGSTSGEQKASAADVLQRIGLEQQKRAIDIAAKTRDAGGAVASAGVPAGGQRVGPAVAAIPGGGAAAVALMALPSAGAAAGADISQQLLDALGRVTFTAYIDGKPVAGQLVATLRSGLEATRAGGIGKR